MHRDNHRQSADAKQAFSRFGRGRSSASKPVNQSPLSPILSAEYSPNPETFFHHIPVTRYHTPNGPFRPATLHKQKKVFEKPPMRFRPCCDRDARPLPNRGIGVLFLRPKPPAKHSKSDNIPVRLLSFKYKLRL